MVMPMPMPRGTSQRRTSFSLSSSMKPIMGRLLAGVAWTGGLWCGAWTPVQTSLRLLGSAGAAPSWTVCDIELNGSAWALGKSTEGGEGGGDVQRGAEEQLI